jgi:hypothetical protein
MEIIQEYSENRSYLNSLSLAQRSVCSLPLIALAAFERNLDAAFYERCQSTETQESEIHKWMVICRINFICFALAP